MLKKVDAISFALYSITITKSLDQEKDSKTNSYRQEPCAILSWLVFNPKY